jgi:hypothetical protein
VVGEPGRGIEGVTVNDDDSGIPWLTDPQRDLLAHLTTIVCRDQLKPEHTYEGVEDALSQIERDGDITLRGDDANVWVLVLGRVIVHAERDWLEWMAQQWNGAKSN